MSVDSNAFKQAMAQFASGVTIVTTAHEDVFYGMTVAAFSSVSLNPPLVLVCIGKSATSCEPVGLAKKFAVHILPAAQEHLGVRFSNKNTMVERFDGLLYTLGATGCPLLDGSLAHVECDVAEAYEAGDHMIYLGRVVAVEVHDVGEPLLHFRRAFRTLSP
jgi:flavin reductase (DIM6/NTAB) family NADH-FMN oxidoreductase RutF